MGGPPKIGVGPKMDGLELNNPIMDGLFHGKPYILKWMIWGVHLFLETLIYFLKWGDSTRTKHTQLSIGSMGLIYLQIYLVDLYGKFIYTCQAGSVTIMGANQDYYKSGEIHHVFTAGTGIYTAARVCPHQGFFTNNS